MWLLQNMQQPLNTVQLKENLTLDVLKANAQYGDFDVKQFTESHDRFIMERCERHDHACMGMTEGVMIRT